MFSLRVKERSLARRWENKGLQGQERLQSLSLWGMTATAKITSIVPPAGPLTGPLLTDWSQHLRAENKAPSTIRTYLASVQALEADLRANDLSVEINDVNKRVLEGFFARMVEGKAAASYVAKHFRQLQQYFKWLAAEQEIPQSPMLGMKPPAVPEQPVPVITEVELDKLLSACKGPTFENRRDYAILRFFIDTGVRSSELADMLADAVDFDTDTAMVMGKGRRERVVPFNGEVADALRRYARMRNRHPNAKSPYFWIGKKGRLTDMGVRMMLKRRVADAGLSHIHPHQFRHTFAHRWLAEGGREQDLMRLAGWRSRQMLNRYGASAADERAIDAYRKMNFGGRKNRD